MSGEDKGGKSNKYGLDDSLWTSPSRWARLRSVCPSFRLFPRDRTARSANKGGVVLVVRPG